jgi:acetyl-CoA carboxylase biotin carboxyl carrier protein
MDFKEIQELLKFVNKSDLTELLIEQEGFKLRIQRKQPAQQIMYGSAPAAMPVAQAPVALQQSSAPATQPSQETPAKNDSAPASGKNLIEFRAPFIGTFYRSSGPDKAPFAKVGDEIRKGQVLGIIEAMKLFNEIESDVEGRIVKILVENAQPVEYDQPLFLIEPA